jgi:replicative DNA helicase
MKKSFKALTEAMQRGDRITGTPSGFDRYDRLTAGLHPGDLSIVAARPGMGKTSFVLNVATNVASPRGRENPNAKGEEGRWDEPGVGVAVFSLEMPREQIANRMLCSEARVDVGKLRQGHLGPQDWSKLTQAASYLGSLPIWIDDTPSLSILELRAKVRRLQAEFDRPDPNGGSRPKKRIGLVVVDYLQLMKGRDGAQSREQEISEISRGLKGLAKELYLPVIALSQLNRAVETRSEKSKRPQLSDLRECVTGDTLVLLADGRRAPIASLVGTTPSVLAMSADKRIVRAKSDKVWSVGKRDVFELRLASGRTLRCTARHRIFTGSGWARLEDVGVDDRVALARSVPEPEATARWSELRLALLGQLVGDGSYLVHQPLRYTTSSEANSEIVARAARAEGATVRRYAGRGNWHQLVISGGGNRWHAKGVNRWLKELGIFGQRSHQKRIPAEVFALGNDQIALLLRHLWATDGCVRPKNQCGSHAVFFSTNSRGLADDVAALLVRLGIVARIRTVQQAKYRPLYNVTVSGSRSQRLFLDRVGAFGPRELPARALSAALEATRENTNVDTLPRQLWAAVRKKMKARGITQRKMAALRGTTYGGTSHFRFAPSRGVVGGYAELLDDEELRAEASSELYWDRVAAIVPLGPMEVFDLTVPGHASWLADGIVSHNSGAIEQDADNIIFIYRDEYYNREATTEPNVAELIIAKQRNGPTGTVKCRFDHAYTRFDNLADGEFED